MKKAKFQNAKQTGKAGFDTLDDTLKTAADTGDGSGADATQGAATISDAAAAELVYMIEEEKLAGDIYEAFYELYGLEVFNRIAQSEDRHFATLVAQAEALGIEVDSFVFEPAGEFENPELQEMYDDLLAAGSQSLQDALEVGKAIEEKDMEDIAEAAEAVEGTALATVYDNLLTGSSYHLAAFDNLL
ncbi:DUF2202 domain-containing protein [Tropicibacter oceani]|uniref:DUF2202 domain-containing protein n=1 Tax=Tropicibacter oceani TaxID=3058420 RepID=A0ABY8QIF8_9RHOB|nr:DUF2202 domain-containing protein [Tropicibacter oceani]WGW03796.1 DUF2202 domain-containing protein [Tropicibacter oceani]